MAIRFNWRRVAVTPNPHKISSLSLSLSGSLPQGEDPGVLEPFHWKPLIPSDALTRGMRLLLGVASNPVFVLVLLFASTYGVVPYHLF